MENSVRKQLFASMDTNYQQFASSLLPNVDNVLGVRLPELRKIARQIAKEDWRTYLETSEEEYFEETMLQGMVIGLVEAEVEERLLYVSAFVPKINNWSVCDSFCAGLTFTKNNKERVWEFIQPYLFSEKEYEVRFGVVMLLNFYIESDYIESVLKLLDLVKHEGFYARMAAAWAVSICYIKFPERTMEFLKNNTLDDFTYNKSLQKIIESTRVSKETKNIMREMKRKKRK
ncbi:DNA alkylation repair protein [Alkalicoccus halolimnae]|uniref:DNA alkylation repair protein n=1 Tax=Alkalicoccus halolimnae TaxID=1667239 RepID=A0A5C7FKJ3_9BACI|nr:DNA alkylation repair protein [Alkalicoccus halolimnae]TXF85335.1 DNA alkylation repair protein [Alkalicoccus halolimnae]